MNVLSLFDGIRSGRVVLERLNINIENYFSSEVDPDAIKIADKNYPQDSHNKLGDVRFIDCSKLPKIDLLIGGSPCFVAGTKIITKQAYKNIEDIDKGDLVLTHTGNFKKVLNTGGKLANTLVVKAQGFKPTETTEEHPFYVRSMNREWDSTNRKYYRKFTNPYWKEAKNLTKGDFIGININTLAENTLNLTSEECYILGRYIADGHTRKDYRNSENRRRDRHWQLLLSIGNEKLEDFKRNISENNFSCYPHSKSVHRIVFSNKRLVEIAETYCGCGAKNKIIPQVFINLPTNLLENVLNGYLDGDGSCSGDVFKATSISEDLIMTLSQAIAKVYRTNSSYEYTKRPKTCIIEGRVVNQNDTYSIVFRKDMKSQSHAKVIGDIIWLPIKCVEYTNNVKMVYNLEVEDDNSYTANNIIVHNCQGFSVAGKRQGSSTIEGLDVVTLEQYLQLKSENFEFSSQSYLFWEYIRILKEVKPKYFLLENVKVTKKWLKMFNEAIGVEPIYINSSDFSAQKRPRYYWTNIKVDPYTPKNILLKDVLEDLPIENKMSAFMTNEFDGVSRLDKGIFNFVNQNKACCLTTGGGHGNKYLLDLEKGTQRKLTALEMERLQTLPDNYTKGLSWTSRGRCIGNGWTVDVIAHILKNLKLD